MDDQSFYEEFEKQFEILINSEAPQPTEFLINSEEDKLFWMNYLIWKQMI